MDVFLTELRKSAGLAGIPESVVRLLFVTGLPGPVSSKIRATPGVKDMRIDALLTMARALIKDIINSPDVGIGAVVVNEEAAPEVLEVGAVAKRLKPQQGKTQMRGCFHCGGPHEKRFCRFWLRTREGTESAGNQPSGNGSGSW